MMDHVTRNKRLLISRKGKELLIAEVLFNYILDPRFYMTPECKTCK